MTAQLLKWLNTDVQLSRTVKEHFEVEFSNGYLFGELLNKHGLLADSEFADSFVDSSTLKAKRNNLAQLKSLLNRGAAKDLDIRIKDEQLGHIMDEDRGASLRLLFQMRKKFLEMPEDREPQHKKDFAPRLEREPKGQHQERFFETTLTKVPRKAPRAVYELHNSGFVHEHTDQMNKARVEEVAVADSLKERQVDFKKSRLDRMVVHKERVLQADIANEESWQANVRRTVKRIEGDLLFEKKAIAKEHAKMMKVRSRHQEDCGYGQDIESHGIGWFEKNLQRIGIDTSEHAGRQPVPRDDGMGHEGLEANNAKELYDQLRDALPHAGQQKVEVTTHMKKIKETKKASDLAQRERDRRLRKQNVENQEKQGEMEGQKREEDLLRWLQTEAVGYRKEAAAYDLNQRYTEAVTFQRGENQRAYAEKASLQREEAFDKFAVKMREERADKLAEREMKKEKEKMRGAIGVEEPDVYAEISSDEGVDWDNDPFGPAKTQVEPEPPRTASARGASRPATMLLDSSQLAESLRAEIDENLVPAKALVECVQDPRTSEYLFSRGDWGLHRPQAANVCAWLEDLQSSSSNQVISQVDEPRIGELVRWLFAPEAPRCGEAELPADYLPIVVLTGNPIKHGNMGSSLKAAQKLCAESGFELVEPRKVVDECIALAQKEEGVADWPPLTRMVELGKIFLEESSKSADGTVPPSVFAEMVFRKIELLSAPPPPPPETEEELAAKAKAKAKAKGKDEAPEVVRSNGVILLGYLTELGQYSSWEAVLRGHMSSLLRTNNGDGDLHMQLSSIIAPKVFAEEDTANYMNLPNAVGTAPVQLLRLRHSGHAELCSKVLSEAGNEKAWQIGDFVPSSETSADDAKGKGKGKKPATGKESPTDEAPPDVPTVLCRGYEHESLYLANPVDRAWLYEDSQRLVDAFAGPLQNCQDVTPICQEEGDEASESAEDALCRQVMEIVAALQKPPAAEEQADAEADAEAVAEAAAEVPVEPVEGEAEEAPKDEDAPLQVVESGVVDPIGAEVVSATPWLALPAESQAIMKSTWLECMSSYVTKLNATMQEVHEESTTYRKGLVLMQRDFLKFSQAPDEKSNELESYLQTWPMRFLKRQRDDINEEVEELSEHLWQFANRRRAESVVEHERLVSSGFWEEHVSACLRLAGELRAIEFDRFRTSAELLSSAYGFGVLLWNWTTSDGSVVTALGDLADASPEALSFMEDVTSWIGAVTESVASASLPLPLVSLAEVDEQGGANQLVGEIVERAEAREAFLAAVGADKVALVQRLHAVEAWTVARLSVMREQLDDALARMDDWIRDRVKVENNAIKAAIAQVLDWQWIEEGGELSTGTLRNKTPTSKSTVKTPTSSAKKHPSSPNGVMRRKRREVLNALYPATLDVDVLQPPKLEVAGALSASGQGPSGKDSSSTASRWTQDMLLALLRKITERTPQTAAISPEALLAAVLEQRSSGFKFDVDLVPPSWVLRSENALAAFCSALVSPSWGNTAVDVTELLLHLTFHERQFSWPTSEALIASRELLESASSGLSPQQLAAYPDVPVSEDLFARLPLWDDKTEVREELIEERPDALKRWIFRVLLCFQTEAKPLLPDSGRPTSATISARRLFTYLGLSTTPMAGLQLALKLMLPPLPLKAEVEGEAEAAEDVAAPQILVQHLWSVLFSSSRPSAAVPSPPGLADFCVDLLPPPPEPEAAAPVGKPGKGAPVPEPVEEELPPPPPEELKVEYDGKLVRNKAVLAGLCSHGGLFCRRRVLATLFPAASAAAMHDTAQAAAAKGLASLVPIPEPPAAEEEEQDGAVPA